MKYLRSDTKQKISAVICSASTRQTLLSTHGTCTHIWSIYQRWLIVRFLSSSFRPAFAPIYANQYSHSSSSAVQPATPQWSGNHHQFSAQQYHSVTSGGSGAGSTGAGHGSNVSGSGTATAGSHKREGDVISSNSSRKEKRQYKKRKHKTQQRDKPYPSPGDLFGGFKIVVLNINCETIA